MGSQSLDKRMQGICDRLGISFTVVWDPNPAMSVQGEVKGKCLLVYNVCEEEAWVTFIHEVIELKLQHLTRVYRTMANCLIEGYEKLAYKEKEDFIESIVSLSEKTNKHT